MANVRQELLRPKNSADSPSSYASPSIEDQSKKDVATGVALSTSGIPRKPLQECSKCVFARL